MDRNTIIGLAVIGLLLVGYSIMTKPQREAQMAERLRQDSIARAEQIRSMTAAAAVQAQEDLLESEAGESADSVNLERLQGELGDFASAATGTSVMFSRF